MAQNNDSAQLPDMKHGIIVGMLYSGLSLLMLGTIMVLFTGSGYFGEGVLSSGFYSVVMALVINWRDKRDLLKEEGRKARIEIEELIKP